MRHQDVSKIVETCRVGLKLTQADPIPRTVSRQGEKDIPNVAFRVLDAPHLKDDYYCSILAYSYASRTLAVALTHKVYLWTEEHGVRYPPLPPARTSNFVTSLAFSSDEGERSILAVARHNGSVTLWSLLEAQPRFEAPHPCPASCAAFRPTVSYRKATHSDLFVACEDLLIGDDSGRIYYYSLEWPKLESGCMSLLIKLDAHRQNICGLAWSPDGDDFVTGGNDNVALLFEVHKVLRSHEQNFEDHLDSSSSQQPMLVARHATTPPLLGYVTPPASPNQSYIAGTQSLFSAFELPARVVSRHSAPATPPVSPPRDQRGRSPDPSLHTLDTGLQAPQGSRQRSARALTNDLANPSIAGETDKHTFSFNHSAAVKAMAFAPWQPTLLATGGGSNDRQIHFHHTGSGAALAVINVFAQVTSLVWSTTRRELAATFGYAQPEHEIRIAVFNWPSCECVVSIPWERKTNGEIGRALWAIPYPGGPNDAVPSRRHSEQGFAAWEAVRQREARRRRRGERQALVPANTTTPEISPPRGRSTARPTETPELARRRLRERARTHSQTRSRSRLRGEGETWASRTEEEGSLIIACCDQTVKFFEVWAGKSKGKGYGLGSKEGVLGGSCVLEGWCEGVSVQEIGLGGEVIR